MWWQYNQDTMYLYASKLCINYDQVDLMHQNGKKKILLQTYINPESTILTCFGKNLVLMESRHIQNVVYVVDGVLKCSEQQY